MQSPLRFPVPAGGEIRAPETSLRRDLVLRACCVFSTPPLPKCSLVAAVKCYQQLPLVHRRLIPPQHCYPEEVPSMPITILSDIRIIMNTNNENLFVVTLLCVIGSAMAHRGYVQSSLTSRRCCCQITRSSE